MNKKDVQKAVKESAKSIGNIFILGLGTYFGLLMSSAFFIKNDKTE